MDSIFHKNRPDYPFETNLPTRLRTSLPPAPGKKEEKKREKREERSEDAGMKSVEGFSANECISIPNSLAGDNAAE